jgi:hypothetical protein
MFEALHKQTAFIVYLGLYGPRSASSPRDRRTSATVLKSASASPLSFSQSKKPKKPGLITIALIVYAINDCSDPSYRPAIPPRKERMNLSVEAIKRGCFLRDI